MGMSYETPASLCALGSEQWAPRMFFINLSSQVENVLGALLRRFFWLVSGPLDVGLGKRPHIAGPPVDALLDSIRHAQ